MSSKLSTPCLLLTLLTLLAGQSQAACPLGCQCGYQQVSCSAMYSLPTQIPSDTTSLSFKDCPLAAEMLPKLPESYVSVTQISFHRCQIHSLHEDAFDTTPYLERLSIVGNPLTAFSNSSVKMLSGLTYLDLSANKISKIEDYSFGYNSMLETLVLDGNHHLELSNQALKNASKIRHVSIQHCNQTKINGPTFCHSKIPALERLDASGNDFHDLGENIFGHMKNLTELELDDCNMTEIKRETFGKLIKLQILNLGHNKLNLIDEQAFDDMAGSLTTLDLQHNNLSSVSGDLFNWGVLTSYNMSYNPWDCTCDNAWMQQYPLAANSTDTISCASPEDHVGHNAIAVLKDMERCSVDSGPNPMIAVYVAIPILVVLTVVTIIIIVKICKLKKKEARGRSAQYSLVYKPTTEKA